MTVASEITRLNTAKSCLKASIEAKWVTVWNVSLSCYYKCVDAIQTWCKVAIVSWLLIWWWGGGWRAYCYYNSWGWWWAWGVVSLSNYQFVAWSYCVTIWAWWWSETNWWNSSVNWIIALWWWHWWYMSVWWSWWSWWWASWNNNWGQWLTGWNWGNWVSCNSQNVGWWWWGACWDWETVLNDGKWWNGWLWLCTCITGHYECFAWWWGGARPYYRGNWCYWGWNSWCYDQNWDNASTCWSWWGWAAAWGRNTRRNWWSWAWWLLIIAYPSWCNYNISWANSSWTCNWVCYHCFTSSWTLTVN